MLEPRPSFDVSDDYPGFGLLGSSAVPRTGTSKPAPIGSSGTRKRLYGWHFLPDTPISNVPLAVVH